MVQYINCYKYKIRPFEHLAYNYLVYDRCHGAFISTLLFDMHSSTIFPWSSNTTSTFFNLFSVRLLSVLRGHSVFSIPATTANDFQLRRIFYPRFYPLHFYVLILQKEPVFPFLMLSAKQANYSYHFYNVFVSYDAFLK